jgi:hypothetical protein
VRDPTMCWCRHSFEKAAASRRAWNRRKNREGHSVACELIQTKRWMQPADASPEGTAFVSLDLAFRAPVGIWDKFRKGRHWFSRVPF